MYGLNCGWNLVVCKVRLGSLTIVSCINIYIVSEKSKTVSNATSMGYPVSQNLIKPDPERNKPMFECPAPWTDKAFKNALGLFSHYPIILGGSRISLGSFILWLMHHLLLAMIKQNPSSSSNLRLPNLSWQHLNLCCHTLLKLMLHTMLLGQLPINLIDMLPLSQEL